MAVHLNARLNTRFIPILFSLVTILILTTSHVARAATPASPEGVSESEFSAIPAPASATNLGETQMYDPLEVPELPETSRLDRRPGFSPITVADPYAMRRKEEPAFPTDSSAEVDSEELERISDQPRDGQIGI